MIQNIKKLFVERLITQMSMICMLTIVAFIVVAVWKWNSLPPQVPLFYSLPRGEEQLTSPIFLSLLPGSSVVFYCVNLFIASRLYPKERLASIFLVLLGTVSSILLLITFMRIIFLIS